MLTNMVKKININKLNSRAVATIAMVFGPSFFLWCTFSPILPAYPVLALELALPVAMAAIAPSLASIFYFMAVALNLMVSISAIFFLTSPLELFFLHEGGVGFSIANNVVAYWQMVIVSIIILIASLVVRTFGRLFHIRLTIAFIVFFIFLDAIAFSKVLPLNSFGPVNIFGSTIAGNLVRLVGTKKDKLRNYKDEQEISTPVVQWAANNPTRSVLFIIVESLGKTVESKESNSRTLNISPPKTNLYKIEGGVVPFAGATTSAELRRLCQLKIKYYEIMEGDVGACLPHKFNNLHYQTIGLHGYSSRVFSRGGWWEKIGFRERIFIEDLPESDYQRCGSTIHGVCDDSMLELAFEKLHRPRTFVYLLTLSTHLPLDESVVDKKIQHDCFSTSNTENLCWIAGMHNKFLTQTVKLASKMENLPLVIIVGDHSPPFLNADERRSFSQDVVPFWIMYPLK